MSKEESLAVKSFLSNEAIIITPADEGNATVVLNASDYDLKATKVIGKKPFERAEKNPRKKVEEGINKIAWRFFSSGKDQKTIL